MNNTILKMRLKSLIGIILWGGMLVACGPDNRVALAEKLMAEKDGPVLGLHV